MVPRENKQYLCKILEGQTKSIMVFEIGLCNLHAMPGIIAGTPPTSDGTSSQAYQFVTSLS